ncbi:MAG: nitroreductase family protein [Desulfovibrio sp.]|nr:nitroreductase family protein [Desulfovibrio sp.]
MPDFQLNTDACISCGLCVQDCLPGALQMVDDRPVMSQPERCIGCQHCLAVCPQGAISILGQKPEASAALAWPTPDTMENLIKGRRSMRVYKQENVAPETVRRLLDVAGHAPTGVCARKLHVAVIDDLAVMNAFRQDVYARLEALTAQGQLPDNPRSQYFAMAAQMWRDGKDMIFRTAPHAVIVSNAKTAPCLVQDPLIHLSYFELMAQSMGLGTVWCGLLYWVLQLMPDLMPRLGIPDSHELGYAMLFGYPALTYQRTVERGLAQTHRVSW